MKKVISIIVIVLGLIAAGFGIHWKTKEAVSIGIIGGADGPTSVFVAGKVGAGMAFGVIAIGVILIVTGMLIYWWTHKKS